jgi:acyl dehydratase
VPALAPYRVRAHNIAADSDNKIHDDAVARQYGFGGGLVPGIAVYGYLTRPLVAQWGEAWLEQGTASARFVSPCYEGADVLVHASGDDPVELTVESNGVVCAQATAGWRTTGAAAPRIEDYPLAPLPGERPPASAQTLAAGTVLGTYTLRLNEERAADFLDGIRDDLPLYRGPRGIAHPALLLACANWALAHNVMLGPWIHTGSDVRHYALARYGETVQLRGRVAECFERKGHEFVVLALVVVAEPDRLVQHIRHTAIYRPRQR